MRIVSRKENRDPEDLSLYEPVWIVTSTDGKRIRWAGRDRHAAFVFAGSNKLTITTWVFGSEVSKPTMRWEYRRTESGEAIFEEFYRDHKYSNGQVDAWFSRGEEVCVSLG